MNPDWLACATGTRYLHKLRPYSVEHCGRSWYVFVRGYVLRGRHHGAIGFKTADAAARKAQNHWKRTRP